MKKHQSTTCQTWKKLKKIPVCIDLAGMIVNKYS